MSDSLPEVLPLRNNALTMTTPAPEKTTGRRRSSIAARRAKTERPQIKLGVIGWTVSWLIPTMLMGVVLLVLSFIPGLDEDGYLTPLIPLIGGAALGVGIPGTLLITWLFRHQLNPVVHVLGYVLVGLLYGPVVLFAGAAGLMPMLIPIIGFPAGVLLGIGRWMAQPMTTVTEGATSEGGDADGDHAEEPEGEGSYAKASIPDTAQAGSQDAEQVATAAAAEDDVTRDGQSDSRPSES